MVRVSSPKSSPCSPACCMAAPRACDSPSLLLVTATPASDPGIHHPGYPICTLGVLGVLVNDPGRRVATLLRCPLWQCWPDGEVCVTSSRGPAEVLRADRVEELAELLDLVFLLVRDRDPGLVQDFLGGEDRGAGPQCERDRVRGPGADLLAVGEDEVREEDPVPQRGDVHRGELYPQRLQHIAEEVVGERPGGDHALLGERDGGSLHWPDPDRQVPVPLGLLEQDDGLVRGHLDPDADDLHLPHGGSVLASRQALSRPELAEGTPLSKYTRPGSRHACALWSAAATSRFAPGETGVISMSAACTVSTSTAMSRAEEAARSLAPGLRCRRMGATTCSISAVSRSADARSTRRCRAWTPYRPSAMIARTASTASGGYCRPDLSTRPNSSSSASERSSMPAASRSWLLVSGLPDWAWSASS